jgi:alpha-beta hydrolase superfamily lysophospholipase
MKYFKNWFVFINARNYKWVISGILYFVYFGNVIVAQKNNKINKNIERFYSINNTTTYFCYDSTREINSSLVLVVYCHGAEEHIQKNRKGYVMERVIEWGNKFANEGYLFAAGDFTLDPYSNNKAIAQIEELRAWCVSKYGVQPKMHIIGYSLGGYAVMLYSKKYPQNVSLITTVAGTLINHIWFKNANSLNALKTIPIRMFHGDKDLNVDYKRSVEFENFFKQKGFDVKLNSYKNADHSTIHSRAVNDLIEVHDAHLNKPLGTYKSGIK